MMLMQQAPTILKYLQGPNNVTSVAGDMTIPLGKNHITEAIDNGYDLGWMENTAKAIGGEALNKGLGLSEIYDPQGHTFTDGFPSDTFDNTPAKMSAEVFKNALDNGEYIAPFDDDPKKLLFAQLNRLPIDLDDDFDASLSVQFPSDLDPSYSYAKDVSQLPPALQSATVLAPDSDDIKELYRRLYLNKSGAYGW